MIEVVIEVTINWPKYLDNREISLFLINHSLSHKNNHQTDLFNNKYLSTIIIDDLNKYNSCAWTWNIDPYLSFIEK